MLSAVSLIFSPGTAWERIALANRSIVWVLFLYLVPCMLLGLGVEYLGLTRLGEIRPDFEARISISPDTALKYVLLQGVGGLTAIAIAAFFLHSVARSFDVASVYTQSFNAVGYAMGPFFILHAADGLPALNTWVVWGIGAALSAGLLYHGVALCLKPEQTKGFGLFVFSVFILIGSTLLVRFVGVMVLNGRFWKAPLPERGTLF